MKIALCMSGHTRTFNKTYKSWYDNLISQYDTDIYFHLWDTVGNKDSSSQSSNFQPGLDTTNSTNVNSVMMDTINLTCKNYNIFIEPYYPICQTFSNKAAQWYVERDAKELRTIDRPHINFSMYYKWYECNKLLNNKQYDVVIRTRPDIMLHDRLPIECFIDAKSLYIPQQGSWDAEEISDYMTIGTQDQITKFCDLYNNIDDMYEWATQTGDFTKVLYPHKMFHYWMQHQNLQYKTADIKCEIIR